jgi:hypothetical protein
LHQAGLWIFALARFLHANRKSTSLENALVQELTRPLKVKLEEECPHFDHERGRETAFSKFLLNKTAHRSNDAA